MFFINIDETLLAIIRSLTTKYLCRTVINIILLNEKQGLLYPIVAKLFEIMRKIYFLMLTIKREIERNRK